MNVGSTAIGWVLAALGMRLAVRASGGGRRRRRRRRVRGSHPERHVCAADRRLQGRPRERGHVHDVEPYVAVGNDGEPVTLGYYGAPGVPGFGLAAIYTDQQFSMVIADADTDDAVACGDILRPDADEFGEAGRLWCSCCPGRRSSERRPRARCHRAGNAPARAGRHADPRPHHPRHRPVSAPADAAAGYDGYVQGGRCESPAGDVHVDLKSRDDDHRRDALPRHSAETGEPVTLGYYGSAGAPGFGVAAAYTDQDFSLVIAGRVGAAGGVRRHPPAGRGGVRRCGPGPRAGPAGR